jgi:2-methylisocitrate lyase-like PEP mutase family enzyme
MTDKTRFLRDILDGDEIVVAASSTTVLAARINERAGYRALYVGGHALGVLHYAIPDYAVLEQHEIISQTRRIAGSVSIPTIVDVDELGGDVAAVYRNVKEYCAAGIAGIHMEDEHEPKHSTYRAPLLAIEDMQARIAAAVEARTDPDFVIIARCNELINRESYDTGTFEEAVRRGQAYAEAGADSLVVPSIAADEVLAFSKAIPVPVTTFGLAVEGARIVLTGFGILDGVYEKWASELFAAGGVLPGEAFQSASDLCSLLDEPDYDAIIQRWAESSNLPTGPSLHGLAVPA